MTGSFLRRHKMATVVSVVVVAAVATVTTLAVHTEGYRSRHLHLDDGGVWVSSDANGLFGRLNVPAGSLDLAITSPGAPERNPRLDVEQDGDAVVVWDKVAGKLYPVDPAVGTVLTDKAVPVAASEQVAMNGGTIAVLQPRTGQVWAVRTNPAQGLTSLAGLQPTAKPLFSFGASAYDQGAANSSAIAVGTDGSVYGATTLGGTAIVRPSGDTFGMPQRSLLQENQMSSVQVSSVGTSLVVYDAKGGHVILPGDQSTDVQADATGRIQMPSPGGNAVVIANSGQLLSIPLSGSGSITALKSNGTGPPAAPTWLGDCVYAAWTGSPALYVTACDGQTATTIRIPAMKQLTDPVFRVNDGSILLNDRTLGSVYDLTSLRSVANWTAVSSTQSANAAGRAVDDQSPRPQNGTFGARPGRTTVLHVLDNDSDPLGSILAITHVTSTGDPNAPVTVSPDQQTVQITLPASGAHNEHFDYTVDDENGLSGTASVTVQVRDTAQNDPPTLRPGFRQHTYSVSTDGNLLLPVLNNWRDFDGDPLVVSSASASAGRVITTPDGQLDYTAPSAQGRQVITYYVTDGIARPVRQQIPVDVLGSSSGRTVAPIAEPDFARGQVGTPITVTPLANDVPGVDPGDPTATLRLAGDVTGAAGAVTTTDQLTGTVTLTASRPGTYLLGYALSYGNAPHAQGTIRVDVSAAPAHPESPITGVDTGVLHGENATTFDALANDIDPAGGVLVVTGAQPADGAGQLQVAVVAGRYLRVQALQTRITPNPAVVRYTVTDGRTPAVTGQLILTQLPTPAGDTPATAPDDVTVRSGASALVPVLDSDVDPAGATLSLLTNVTGAPHPGQLPVTAQGSTSPAQAGVAFVSGDDVRYIAPTVTRLTQATVAYVAQNAQGRTATGVLHVTVTPPVSAAHPDRAPTAVPIQARAISGTTITIDVPSLGVDPDGDPVTLQGVMSTPRLGRIVATGPSTITYVAAHGASGTDRFTYRIVDPYGMTSTATVSVGVAPSGQRQPPIAVDDTANAAPDAQLRLDVLGNDIVAAGDRVSIADLHSSNAALPSGVELLNPSGPIEVTAPAAGRSLSVAYTITDSSGQSSTATITVHGRRGYVTPPDARDITAKPATNASTVTVDVLAVAADPRGLSLHVVQVFDPQARVFGRSVRIPVTDHAQSIAVEVANSDGGTAAAVITVAAGRR